MIFSMLFTLNGCGRGTGSENNAPVVHKKVNIITFRTNLFPEPTTLDPVKARTESEILLINCLYDTLFEKNGSSIKGRLAERWAYSEDGKELTIHLKKGVKFHNGRSLTAEDVEFSLKRAAGYFREQYPLYGIRFFDLGFNVFKENDYTLSITFSSPAFNFHEILTLPIFSIVNKEALEKNPEYGAPGDYFNPAAPVVGTGPYKFVEWVNGKFLTLASNANYHGGKVSLERLEFVFYDDLSVAAHDFVAHDLDVITLDYGNYSKILKEYPELKNSLKKFLTGNKYYLGFNLSSKIFGSPEIRDAVLNSLDTKKIQEDVMGSVKLLKEFGKGDKKEAKEILDNLVHNSDNDENESSNNGTLRIVLGFTEGPVQNAIAESIKEQLEPLGIEVSVRSFPNDSETRSFSDLYILKQNFTLLNFVNENAEDAEKNDNKKLDSAEEENQILLPLAQEYNFYCVHNWIKFYVNRDTGTIDFFKMKKILR